MLSFPPAVRIWLALAPTDLRKGFDARNRPRPGARLWGIGLATRLLFRNMKACRWRLRRN
jgi:hypothetical protein